MVLKLSPEVVVSWLIFIGLAGITGIVMLSISFFAGLPGDQRKTMLRRVRTVIMTAESSQEEHHA